MEPIEISPHLLSIDVMNPRRFYEEKHFKKLLASVEVQGILTPLIVRKKALPDGVEPLDPTKLKYSVICGSRRLEVAKRLELASVPCIVKDLGDPQAADIAITEQDSAETLHFLERAEHFQMWKKAGATVEEIAGKVEQSTSAVHAVIALNNLTPEAKKACYGGLLPETSARDLCTVPQELQGNCLKKMLEPGITGEKQTTREMREVIDGFRLDLKDAPFDVADDELLKDVARCGPCPYRSENRLALFGDLKNPNLCLNPPCHARKAEAAWQRRVDDGSHNRGPRCITGKDGERLFDERGQLRDDTPYVDAHAICYEDTAQRPHAALLGKAPQQHYWLARSPKGAVLELLERSKLKGLLDEAGKIRRPPAAKTATKTEPPDDALTREEKKKLAEKLRLKVETRVRVVAAIAEKVKKRDFDKKGLRMMADWLFNQAVVPEEVMARRDIKESPKAYLDRLNEGDLRALLFECVGGMDLYGQPGSERHPEGLKRAAEYYSVELDAIEREVKAEARVKPKVVVKADEAKKGAAP